MTMLTAVSEAEFSTLRDSLEVSDSVLSKHVGALASLGYVGSHKGVHRGRRTTWIWLTAPGRAALGAHVAALREVIAGEQADPGRRTDLQVAAGPMSNRLRELRAARHWTQADLADRLDISEQTVNAIETGHFDPSLSLAFTIAAVFKGRIEDLFFPAADTGPET
ncbi:transcriptional regulator [Frankia sp. AgB32]|uniref:transcriptional regulator n=1 Tax=Frankia sp. AgB32 TaxID=631119 RepID=UPI00200E219E|nr:transcriptional regulator [Frankia sp. AgB32]MCK9897692.1 transcriptional regulator [Frankia sp. AgB32]